MPSPIEKTTSPAIEPNPKSAPTQTKEAEVSAPPKQTKRKREAKKVATIVSKEKT